MQSRKGRKRRKRWTWLLCNQLLAKENLISGDVLNPESGGFYISFHFAVFLSISLHFSAFLCISLHFSAFLCISLRFSTCLCNTLPLSEFLHIPLHFSAFYTLYFWKINVILFQWEVVTFPNTHFSRIGALEECKNNLRQIFKQVFHKRII